MTELMKFDQLPLRMVCCENGGGLSIKEWSNGFALLLETDFHNDEEKLGQSFLGFIYSGDQKRFLEQIAKASKTERICETRCRLIRSDGTLLWTMCQISTNAETVLLNFTEIHEMMKSKIRLQRSMWCYRAILNETVDYVFQFDPLSNSLKISFQGAGEGHEAINCKELESPERFIHPEDRGIYLKTKETILNGSYSINLEVRARIENSDYHWFRIQGIVTPAPSSHIPAVIGTLTDIDKEKKAILRLTEQAHTDSLTGLLNKAAAQSAVDTYLKDAVSEETNALLVIDIDNFKICNDTKGHLFGDAVLVSVSDILKRCFNSSDIVGRLGGDEFIAFMKNIPTLKIIEEKASEVIKALKHIPLDKLDKDKANNLRAISCSIGIAVSPGHGQTFRDLFQNADTAMYRAKVSGKSRFAYCDNSHLNQRISLYK